MRFAPHRWLALACLCAAELGCTEGIATPITLLDASPNAEAGASGGSAGATNVPPKGGRGAPPFGGSPGPGIGTAGGPDSMGFSCGMDSDDPYVAESEAQFRKLLSEAIQAEDSPFCIKPPLANRSEYRCLIAASAFAVATAAADPRIPRVFAPPEGWSFDRWVSRHAESAADVKNQMFSEMATRSNGYRAFCGAAAEEHYSGFVVARSSDSWVVGFVPDPN